ncbi:P-loop containing nucleoside triphosphate hydrolase protein [Mycena olivaceomarginata]|nr:P-loop containing nucleoside triphosphate hydrolase protein [Mycena olivaceomarginata]
MAPQTPGETFLRSLNAAQLQAVLTSRIAYLILHHLLPPSSICAVTFTNKAATEMRERLSKLIGKQRMAEVRMGTFHALCALYLRKFSRVVGIEPNFTVCDAEESKKIISGFLKHHKDFLSSKDINLKDGALFTEHPPATSWCRHVLVDELTRTVTQYELLRAIAAPTKGCVTIVGDPDQSIYGWRSAEVGNLAKMRKDFVGTTQIFLEENYRSTGSILKASLAIVSQDKSRIPKTLLTSHPSGTTPPTSSPVEIKRLVAFMGGVLRWGDFAILLRFSALSRAIESALQKEAIPSAVLGGHKFFERQEIKDILAYLQLVDNPSFMPALTRAINVPSRGIGEKSLEALISRAAKTKISPLEAIERIHDAVQPDIKPAVKHKVGSFVRTGASPPDLIQRLLQLIEYETHLKRTQPEWESRWENVQELVTFASDVEHDINLSDPDAAESSPSDTPLRLFLQASMLSSEGDNQSEEDSKEKVTITTCHAAKGLEWPVVIIPAVEQGTFPFYRTDDVQERGTRRLLYVACTRAQSLLYLSHVSKRQVGGETKPKDISEFISAATKEHSNIFTARTSQFSTPERTVISRVLGRVDASEVEVARRVAEFRKTTRLTVSWHPALATPGNAPRTASFVASSAMASTSLTPPQKAVSLHPMLLSNAARPSSHVQPPPAQVLVPSRQKVGTTPAPATATPGPPKLPVVPTAVSTGGVKRRLGMARGTMGFPSKKFKPPI